MMKWVYSSPDRLWHHGNSKQHPYGANGEHKHLWTWQDGKAKEK